MGLRDKAEEMKGRAKVTAGKASDNKKLQMEGHADKLNGKAGQLLDKDNRGGYDKHDAPMN